MKKITLLTLLFLSSYLSFSQVFIENFEGSATALPTGWNTYQNAFGTEEFWKISSLVTTQPSVCQGSNAATIDFENIGIGNTSEDYLVTPSFQVPTNGELKFLSRQASPADQGTIYQIRLSTNADPSLLSAYVTIKSWTEFQMNTIFNVCQEQVVNLNAYASQNVHLAFVRVGTQTTNATVGDQWFIDNIQVVVKCFEPTAGSSNNFSATTATLSWNNPTGVLWDIELRPISQTITGQPTIAGVTSTTTGDVKTYQATGLTPGTTYRYYVRNVCDPLNKSLWVGPFSFVTRIYGSSCNDPIQVTTLPYQSASSTALFLDLINNIQSSSASCGAVPPTTVNYMGGNEAFYKYTATETGQINITNTPRGPNSSIFIYPGCPITGPCLAGVANAGSGVRTIPNFAVVAGQSYTIVISSALPTQTIGYTLLIQRENCAAPVGSTPTIAQTTLTSAVLSWTNTPGTTSWQVAVQPLGQPIPSGIGTTVGNNSYTATGLTSGTQYQYWVRAECATPGVFSVWSGPYLFNTLICAPEDQCVHNFRMFNVGGSGWNGARMEVRQNNIVIATIGSTFTAGAGPVIVPVQMCKDLPFDVLWLTTGTTPAQVKLEINNSFGQTIYTKPLGQGTAGTILYNSIVNCTTPVCNIAPINSTVTLLTTTTATLGWTAPATTNWDIFVVPFGNPPPTVASLPTYANVSSNPFLTTIPLLPDTQYTFYVRVVCTPNPSPWSIGKDFTTIPTCIKPTALSVTSITGTAATLGWTNGLPTHDSWEILLVPSPTSTLPTQLPPVNPTISGGTLLIPTTTPSTNTVTGLTPATIYFYYIRTVCPGNDKSTWAGPFVFNTITCDPTTKCVYRFRMYDLGGNGWDATRMQVRQNGIVVATLGATFQAGSGPTIFGVQLCPDVPFDLFWLTAGANPTDVGVDIINTFTDVIYTKLAGQGAAGQVLFQSTGNCTPPTCPKPTNLVATNTTQSGATLGWTEVGTATQWEVYVLPNLPTLTPPVNGAPLGGAIPYYITNTNSLILTGLNPATGYTYWVRSICLSTNISTWTILNPGTFTTKQINDDCDFAINVPVNPNQICTQNVQGSTFGGSLSLPTLSGVGCGISDDDVWYKFTATNNIHIIKFNNILGFPSLTTINHSLFTGNCATLTNLYCSTNPQSVATGLVIGQTYYIRVYTAGNVAANYANFTLCIQTPPPAATNDNCIVAITAVVNTNSKCNLVTPGNVIGATASTPAISVPCVGSANDDVWFKFTALSGTHYFNLLNVSGTTTNLNHAVYSGACNNLTQLFCSTENNLASNYANFVVGQVYYVRVWSNEALSQVVTFNLCIKSVSTCDNAEFLCGTTPNDAPYIIDNTTGIIPGGGNIACLFSTPNPTYYVLKIGQTGPVKFEIRQSTDNTNFPLTGPPGIDVDFVAWGPFPDAQSCSQISLTSCAPCPNNVGNPTYYPSGNIVDCSYSFNPVETLTINNAQAGEFYVLLLTNFNGAAGYIKLIQTNTLPVPGQPTPGETICCDVKLGPDKNICGSSLVLNSLINVDPLTIPTSYKWYFNGVLIAGATSATYTATLSGTYKVIGTCNQSSTSDEIVVKISPIISLAIPTDYQLCDGLPADGFEIFNLLSRNTLILGSLDPTKYTVSYHLTLANATDDINPIVNVATHTNTVVNMQTIFVRVESNELNACFDVKPLKLVVSTLANGNFTYPSNQFCKNQPNPAPITLGQIGTVVIVPSSGLSINLTTLQINLALTTPGNYTITNTIPASGGCSVVVASTTITVYPESDILLESGCEGTKYLIVAKPVNNSFDLATATFAWAGSNFEIVTGRPNAIEAKASGNYTVTVTTPDGCKSTETLNVTSVLCQIQKGISPNGDGKNDSFELTSLGVSKLEIFNRYGTLVYNLDNYTNQWTGQSNADGELPDGTYFYVIQKADGSEGITGWIYINR